VISGAVRSGAVRVGVLALMTLSRISTVVDRWRVDARVVQVADAVG
jgi:hypothetical protein